MKCLLCNALIKWHPPIRDLLSLKALRSPRLCKNCRSRFIPLAGGKGCPGCQRQGFNQICPECQAWQERVGFCLPVRACFSYNEAMKEFMHAYKFAGDYRLHQAFSFELTALVKESGAEVVIPLPLHPATQKERGFNQVKGLLECQYQSLLITKDQEKPRPQSVKNRQERLATPQPFRLLSSNKVAGKSVVLVDDVFTTGRTMYHAAELIKDAGCKTICGVTLAN